MKKTTIRIVGFLFAAACVALLASCKNPTTTPKKTDDKTPPPAEKAFKKDQLKGTWRYDTGGVYLFNFDDSATLRVAYGSTFAASNIKTRAAEVEYEVKGGNANSGTIKIKFGGVTLDSPFSLTDDNVLTIKDFISKDNTVVLKKVTKDADVNVLKNVTFNRDTDKDTVVTNFNQNILGAIPSMPKSRAYKIVKLNNKEPGLKKDSTTNKKVYHVAFGTTTSDLVFAVELKTDKKKSTSKNYTVTPIHEDLGKAKIKITISALDLTDKVVTFVRDAKNDITTITMDDEKTKFEYDADKYGTITSGATYNEADGDVTTAITNFHQNET